MRYCGIAFAGGHAQLATLEEVRADEPPIRLRATFYEPGAPAGVVRELASLGEVVVAVGAAAGQGRACDEELARRGIAPAAPPPEARELFAGLGKLGVYLPTAAPAGTREGEVEEGAFHRARVIETQVEAVFAALQGRRLPARRHPLGVARRIQELVDDHVVDEGGELWHRRIEEIEAAACALAAHRYALAHANWLGDPDEAVIVLPGARTPERFSTEGVIPPVPRRPLPGA
ncbi:MAG: hypothetical protein IRZ21_00245 [Thermoleophilaceae bacterium]|nr:hypothetical protein [Thermoleophilaceae bacterium]